MRVRDWQDILSDVVERDVEPEGWRAVGGSRDGGIGEDLYLGHPSAGVFLLKTYAKNPYEVRGVGTRVARSIDDEIGGYMPEDANARFGLHSPPEDEDDAASKAQRLEQTIRAHADAPTEPDDLFEDVMDALDSPAFGPMEFEGNDRPESLEGLSTTFEDAEAVLETELDDLVDEDGIGRSFG